jgi:hypothetical protein
MQPTIHWERKAGFLPRPHPGLRSKCIVGCIFNSIGRISLVKYPVYNRKVKGDLIFGEHNTKNFLDI